MKSSKDGVEITLMSAGSGVRRMARALSAWSRRRGCRVTFVVLRRAPNPAEAT